MLGAHIEKMLRKNRLYVIVGDNLGSQADKAGNIEDQDSDRREFEEMLLRE